MKRLIQMLLVILVISGSNLAWGGNKLFVGGLPFGTTSDEVDRLIQRLDRHLPILSIKTKSVDDNGEMSAEAVVNLESEKDRDFLEELLDGYVYKGDPLTTRKKVKEIVVVGSKVKEVIREAGLRSDGELVQAVSDKVHELLEEAIGRAIANKRGTVRPYDL